MIMKQNVGEYEPKRNLAMVKNPTTAETIRLNRLCWFGHVQRMEENGIYKIMCEFGNNKAER